ncbi:unnamed protein product, partial [Adineta steineri]
IYNLVQKLYDLPINGKLIQEQVTKMNQGRAQAATTDERYIELPIGYNSPQILENLKKIVSQKKR